MEITFLGTASCIPSESRGVSCIALRYRTETWLFDCGEASQLQLQRSKIRPSKITKVFLSHLHGDHSFGLPGVLCLMGQSTLDERGRALEEGEESEVIDIYGPEGTRDFVRSIVQLTYSKIVAPHRIHELKDVPNLHHKNSRRPFSQVKTRMDTHFGEIDGSKDIYPDSKGCYVLLDNEEVTISAAPMQHTIPCVGFVVQEKSKPGKLKVELVKPLVEKNAAALVSQLSLKKGDPLKALQHLKLLPPDSSFVFPDGTTVYANDILEPPKKGRKVVIMGDTCSGDMIAELALDADVLIHEATNAWIKEQDAVKYPSYLALEKDTLKNGHSTPQMAGRFARRINSKKLILTHFSPRYRGEADEYFMKQMWKIENMARETSGLFGDNDVIAAWDYLMLPIPQINPFADSNSTTAAVSNENTCNSIDFDTVS